MKNILVKSFTGFLAVLLLGVTAFAQNAKRIDLAKGGPSIVWEERVAANSSKSFVFYAKKGQKLSISFFDDTNVGSMDLGKLSIEPNGDAVEMEIEVSKDYNLSVSNNSNKATSFRISISLYDADDPAVDNDNSSNESAGERVKFAKGETSASLTRDIPANGSIDFIVNAKKGQTLDFTVGYDFKDSDITVFLTEPGLQDISLTAGPKERNEFVINKTGDHRITVNNTTRKKITTTIYLGIFDYTDDSVASGDSDEPVFEDERIQFGRGETDATLDQSIAPGVNKTFYFKAKKGQIVWFKVSDRTGKIAVDFNKNPVKPNVEVRQILNASGDWAIYVSNPTNKTISYTLWIGIE